MQTVAISIATHNRKDDLRRTLEQLATLNPAPSEILVGADNCNDGTLEMMRADFPDCTLLINTSAKGSIETRDAIVKAATADVVLSLDDDSYPLESDFLTKLSDVFESDRSIGLITFPQKSEEWPESLECSNFGPSQWVGSYPNSGAAFRRDLYLQLPGYPLFFFHAYEEPDFALQLWAAGYRVLHYTGLTVRHHWTQVQRNEGRTHRRHARNEFLSIVLRCPILLLLPLAFFRAVRQMGYAFKRGKGWVVQEPQWWREALLLFPQAWKARRAVPFKAYWAWLKLVRTPQLAELKKETES